MRISFLLGSGMSIPFGMPTTLQLTKKVLSGENVHRHSDGKYYFKNPNQKEIVQDNEFVSRLVSFLKIVNEDVILYYKNRSTKVVSYEDLYYVIDQLAENIYGNYDNPAIESYSNILEGKTRFLLFPRDGDIRKDWSFNELLDESLLYIRDVIAVSLFRKPEQVEKLTILGEIVEEKRFLDISFFTLNHDLVLEKFFDKKSIEFSDGFGEAQNEVRYWDPNSYQNRRIKIFKLHGGVNWYQVKPIDRDWGENTHEIGIFEGYPNDIQSPAGEKFSQSAHAFFLTGTFNKMLDYNSGIYWDIRNHFYQSLSKINYLVVSGYSFSDKGINTNILEWKYKNSDNKLIVIHPNENELLQNSRLGISSNFSDWLKKGDAQFQLIQSGFEEISLGDLSIDYKDSSLRSE
jgi:hypothetical protein